MSCSKLPANHPLAYLFTAFIATAGIFYINIQPGIVSALIEGLSFTEQQAGLAMSMNSYGATLGAFLAFFWVGSLHWKHKIAGLFLALIVIELGTQYISDPLMMNAWRFFAGLVGGASVGLGFSILSRLHSPDRAFGTLIATQFLLGSVVIYVRSWIEELVGIYGVFYVLALFVTVSFVMLFALDDYEVSEPHQTNVKPRAGAFSLITGTVLLSLLAISLFQGSANAVWTFVERIGVASAVANDQVSSYVSLAFVLSIPAAFIPIIIGNRFGRLPMIISGVLLASVGVLMLLLSDNPKMYFAGMLLLNIAWAYSIAYLLAIVASYDKTGRIAILGGTASKLGLATGPMLGSMLIGDGDYSMLLIFSAIGFGLCLLAALRPTLSQDKKSPLVIRREEDII